MTKFLKINDVIQNVDSIELINKEGYYNITITLKDLSILDLGYESEGKRDRAFIMIQDFLTSYTDSLLDVYKKDAHDEITEILAKNTKKDEF
jgi:hypothetical protein